MTELTTKELEEQNRRLRCLIVSISASQLRKIALDIELHRPLTTVDAENLVSEAEECFRCARLMELKNEIAKGLEAAGYELMSRAVQIETDLVRAKRRNLEKAKTRNLGRAKRKK